MEPMGRVTALNCALLNSADPKAELGPRNQDADMGVSENRGTLFVGPYNNNNNKDPTI